MTDLTIGQAQRMTAPAPFALLTSADKEGKTNIMAVSWWTYLSNHPVKIGACLSNKGYSGGNIREGGEFAICVVDEQLRDSALQCGRCSGRSTDKASELGIELAEARTISPKVVAASKVVFECKLSDMLEVGDHTFLWPTLLPYMAMTAKSSCLHTTATDVSAPLSKADKSNCAFCTEHSGAPCIFLQKTCWTPYKRF